MNDLISRQAAIEAIPEVEADIFENCGRCELLTKEDVVEILRGLPSAEVEPVKHGRWREYNYPGQECVYCSACKTEYYPDDLIVIGVNDYPYYCPNCGARMDLEGEPHEQN